MQVLLYFFICFISTSIYAEETSHTNIDYKQLQQHHLNRISIQKNTHSEILQAQCKYESDISEKPPARKIALTFDDGPIPGHTEDILAILKKHHAPASFFVVGEHAKAHPHLMDLITSDGHHRIGNHSWDHPNFHDLSISEQATQITKTESVLLEKEPKLFRYPFGNSSCESNQFLQAHNYKIVGWHIDSCDWAFSQNGEMNIADRALCGVDPDNIDNYVHHVVSKIKQRNGGIVLFHETHRYSIMKLDELLTQLEQEGFEFSAMLDNEFASFLK